MEEVERQEILLEQYLERELMLVRGIHEMEIERRYASPAAQQQYTAHIDNLKSQLSQVRDFIFQLYSSLDLFWRSEHER